MTEIGRFELLETTIVLLKNGDVQQAREDKIAHDKMRIYIC